MIKVDAVRLKPAISAAVKVSKNSGKAAVAALPAALGIDMFVSKTLSAEEKKFNYKPCSDYCMEAF